jgi:hypothetical protein
LLFSIRKKHWPANRSCIAACRSTRSGRRPNAQPLERSKPLAWRSGGPVGSPPGRRP